MRNGPARSAEYGHVLLNVIPLFSIFVSSIALNKEEEEEEEEIAHDIRARRVNDSVTSRCLHSNRSLSLHN
jgi:hypothetical protein